MFILKHKKICRFSKKSYGRNIFKKNKEIRNFLLFSVFFYGVGNKINDKNKKEI